MEFIKANNLDELIVKSRAKTLITAPELLRKIGYLEEDVNIVTSTQLFLGGKAPHIVDEELEIMEKIGNGPEYEPEKPDRSFILVFNDNLLFNYHPLNLNHMINKKLEDYELITSNKIVSKIFKKNKKSLNY